MNWVGPVPTRTVELALANNQEIPDVFQNIQQIYLTMARYQFAQIDRNQASLHHTSSYFQQPLIRHDAR